MEFTATPSDVLRVVDTAQRLERNPVALAGRFAGLSGPETRSGVPGWAWLLVAVGVGAAVMYRFAPAIRRRFE